jgi:RecB family exonuclease
VAALAPGGRFYSRSFAVDALGTAGALLELRDSLVEAGWDGQHVADGGERLRALDEIEQLGAPALLGNGDRVRDVERALCTFRHRVYDEIVLAEPAAHWPQRWQRIFDGLARERTQFTRLDPLLPGASCDGDLRRVQRALEGASEEGARIEGDGSLVLLTAETSWEAAQATAAIIAALAADETVVVREADTAALDHALAGLGLSTQGLRVRSPWRAALQVLPLALELAFEPKDPCRVLELLAMPGGPFQGRAGRRLARAVARSPGIGGPAWEQAKAELGMGSDSLRLIEQWFEGPAADPIAGAPKTLLRSVVERVHAWLLSRVASAPDDEALLAAASTAAAFRIALEREPRGTLDRYAVRQLVTLTIGEGSSHSSSPEQSGRLDHVDRASGLTAPRRNVVWWFFADTGRRPPRLPWRRREIRALAAIGVHFPDARARLLELARQRRRALRCATERAILGAPRVCSRDRLALDPVWHEIQASARLDAAACHRLTLEARVLLAPAGSPLLGPLRRVTMPRAALPGGHDQWNVPSMGLRTPLSFSATSASALLGCPLRWVLSYAARLKSARLTLPRSHQLAGTLGHRLVEVLHREGAFEAPPGSLEGRARAQLEELIRREGALLSRPGMSFERGQVAEQLVNAVLQLDRSLRGAGLRIISVEQQLRMPWRGGELEGRLDLLVASADGREHILDLKWGIKSYRDALENGTALQLAAYTALHAHGGQQSAEAAFFHLKRGKLVGLSASALPIDDRVKGPSLSSTWAAVERSVDAIEAGLQRGSIPVTGLRRSLPLLDALGVGKSDQPGYFSARRDSICAYCDFDALCGRRWEAPNAGE